MTTMTHCPLCDAPELEERTRFQMVSAGNTKIRVSDLKYTYCRACEAHVVLPEQTRHNAAKVKASREAFEKKEAETALLLHEVGRRIAAEISHVRLLSPSNVVINTREDLGVFAHLPGFMTHVQRNPIYGKQ